MHTLFVFLLLCLLPPKSIADRRYTRNGKYRISLRRSKTPAVHAHKVPIAPPPTTAISYPASLPTYHVTPIHGDPAGHTVWTVHMPAAATPGAAAIPLAAIPIPTSGPVVANIPATFDANIPPTEAAAKITATAAVANIPAEPAAITFQEVLEVVSPSSTVSAQMMPPSLTTPTSDGDVARGPSSVIATSSVTEARYSLPAARVNRMIQRSQRLTSRSPPTSDNNNIARRETRTNMARSVAESNVTSRVSAIAASASTHAALHAAMRAAESPRRGGIRERIPQNGRRENSKLRSGLSRK